MTKVAFLLPAVLLPAEPERKSPLVALMIRVTRAAAAVADDFFMISAIK